LTFTRFCMSTLFQFNDVGKTRPNGKYFEFKKNYKAASEYFYTALHVIAGQPPRSTEMVRLRLRNKMEDGIMKMRGVYIMKHYGGILFLPPHNKRGEKEIARFITGEMCNLFIMFAAILRPALEYVNYTYEQINGNTSEGTMKTYTEYDWFYIDTNGARLSSDDIRHLFCSIFNRIYSVDFSFNDYRQVYYKCS